MTAEAAAGLGWSSAALATAADPRRGPPAARCPRARPPRQPPPPWRSGARLIRVEGKTHPPLELSPGKDAPAAPPSRLDRHVPPTAQPPSRRSLDSSKRERRSRPAAQPFRHVRSVVFGPECEGKSRGKDAPAPPPVGRCRRPFPPRPPKGNPARPIRALMRQPAALSACLAAGPSQAPLASLPRPRASVFLRGAFAARLPRRERERRTAARPLWP